MATGSTRSARSAATQLSDEVQNLVGRVWRLFSKSDGARPLGRRQEKLEALIQGRLRSPDLYATALRHKSVLRETPEDAVLSNERLEFLGDAVLGVVVAEHLYKKYPEGSEGFLTRMRAKLVNRPTLSKHALRIGLQELVEISRNMERLTGRENESMLADALEALFGAVYLDMGYRTARDFILRTVIEEEDLDRLAAERTNYKSVLLELVQSTGTEQPSYRLVSEEGPDHAKRFTMEVLISGESKGLGVASSKKQAEQIAARQALVHLDPDRLPGDEYLEEDRGDPSEVETD